jgi:multiple sugar transport system permease protein
MPGTIRHPASRKVLMQRSTESTLFVWGAIVLTVAFFMVWYILPIAWTVGLSFFQWSPGNPNNRFIGLENYREALLVDHIFWQALRNSVYFTFGNVILGTSLALLIANALRSIPAFKTLVRLAYFLPAVVTVVAAAVVWKAIFEPRFGILNNGLYFLTDLVGLPGFPEIGWTTTTEWSMPTIILFGLWKYLGLRVIILLAAMEAVPRMYYEAAEMDGANRWQQFWYVTLPNIRPALWFVLITGVINSLQIFEPMFVVTEGGPARSTTSLVMLVLEQAFKQFRFGYGAAISVILFTIIAALSLGLFGFSRRRQAA